MDRSGRSSPETSPPSDRGICTVTEGPGTWRPLYETAFLRPCERSFEKGSSSELGICTETVTVASGRRLMEEGVMLAVRPDCGESDGHLQEQA